MCQGVELPLHNTNCLRVLCFRCANLQDMSDFQADRAMYPQATVVHWKILLREINALRGEDVSDRRLEEKKADGKKPVGSDGKKPVGADGKNGVGDGTKAEPKVDFSTFKGVELKSDKSLVSFGSKHTFPPETC